MAVFASQVGSSPCPHIRRVFIVLKVSFRTIPVIKGGNVSASLSVSGVSRASDQLQPLVSLASFATLQIAHSIRILGRGILGVRRTTDERDELLILIVKQCAYGSCVEALSVKDVLLFLCLHLCLLCLRITLNAGFLGLVFGCVRKDVYGVSLDTTYSDTVIDV